MAYGKANLPSQFGHCDYKSNVNLRAYVTHAFSLRDLYENPAGQTSASPP
jgi:hypothetical protein